MGCAGKLAFWLLHSYKKHRPCHNPHNALIPHAGRSNRCPAPENPGIFSTILSSLDKLYRPRTFIADLDDLPPEVIFMQWR